MCYSFQILRSFPYGPVSGFQKIEILKVLSMNFDLMVIPFSLPKLCSYHLRIVIVRYFPYLRGL